MTIRAATSVDPSAVKPLGNPAISIIQNFALEPFERAVYQHEYEKAGQLMLDGLRKLKAGAVFIGYATIPPLQKILYTRMSAAIVALLADPGFSISPDGFASISAEHATIDLLFRASAFGTSDHLLPQLSDNPLEVDRSKVQVSNGMHLAKFMLTYSLRSGFTMDFEGLFKANRGLYFPLWVGMMSALLTVNQQAQDRRERLLGLHGEFSDVDVHPSVLPSLSDAYMYASYSTRPDKHDVKATIHGLFKSMAVKHGLNIPPADQLANRRSAALLSTKKPVMLVCVEWFSSLHAMYRCYAPIVRQLRTKFRLVGMCRESDIDAIGKAEFDEWYPVPAANILMSEVLDKINEIKPAVIYHPSLGMSLWWNFMASLRLAPIQMMMLGHPASSRSPCMDYALVEQGIAEPALFTERVVEYPQGSARFVMRPDAVWPEVRRALEPDVVKIAVPAMLCKLNAPFLATLAKIQAQAARPVEFHFFVNMINLNLNQSADELRDWLPNCKVYERTAYPEYLKHLSECHIHCSPFPFGGTNSNIDSMKLGIPIVTRWGDEPHERYDGMMLRRVGLPEFLIAKTSDEYIAAATMLISDHDLRNKLSGDLAAKDLDAVFFGDPPADQKTAIIDIVWNLYLEHGNEKRATEGTEGDRLRGAAQNLGPDLHGAPPGDLGSARSLEPPSDQPLQPGGVGY